MTEFDGLPVLREPVAIAAFEGWNDAADASTAVVEHLEEVWQARQVTTLDPEDFYDFQVSRPIVTRMDDDSSHLEWPTTRFTVATPPGTERDVVLIRGIEPSMRWRTFCEQVLEVCHALEVNRIVLLGALLADVPYTRPLPVSGSASGPEMAERSSCSPPGTRARPASSGSYTRRATVPSSMRCRSGCMCPTTRTTRPAPRPPWRSCTASRRSSTCRSHGGPGGGGRRMGARVRAAAEQDADLAEYVQELEQRAGDAGLRPLSGDEIATEFERYLRARRSAVRRRSPGSFLFCPCVGYVTLPTGILGS